MVLTLKCFLVKFNMDIAKQPPSNPNNTHIMNVSTKQNKIVWLWTWGLIKLLFDANLPKSQYNSIKQRCTIFSSQYLLIWVCWTRKKVEVPTKTQIPIPIKYSDPDFFRNPIPPPPQVQTGLPIRTRGWADPMGGILPAGLAGGIKRACSPFRQLP